MPDSNAIVDFRESLGMAHKLLELESKYDDPPVPNDLLVVSGLRGGAAVLMVAAFEDFVRRVLLERLAPFGDMPPLKNLSALPTKVQVGSAYSSLEQAMYGPRYGSVKGKHARLSDIHRSAKILMEDRADVIALSDLGGNPGPDALGNVLRQLDIDAPFSAIQPEFDRRWQKSVSVNFVREKLEEIVLRRHRVAHAGDVLNVSRADLQDGLEFIHTLAETLDAFLESHILSL